MIFRVLSLAAFWLPAFADTDCAEAYRRGCYKRSPFKGCCQGGQCQSATESIKCRWAINQPCCPELEGEFPVNPEAECESACLALGRTGLTARDFCPGSELEASLSACPAAHDSWSRAYQKYSHNNRTREGLCSPNAMATCSWSYPGSKEAEDVTKGGYFNFPMDEVACFDVCTELGGWGISSDIAGGGKSEYCNMFKGMFEPGKYNCPSAARCFNDTSLPGCQGLKHAYSICGGTVAGVASQSLRKAAMSIQVLDGVDLDDYCNQAYQDGCWKADEFSGCCSECSTGEHEFSSWCKWNFRFKWGQASSDSQQITHRVDIPEDLQGSVDSCGQACPCQAACRYLGDPKNNPCWYCNTPEQWKDAKLNCPAAFNFTVDPGWCSSCNAKGVLMASDELLARNPVLAAAGATMTFVAMVAIVATLKSRWHVDEDGHQALLQS